MPQVTLDEKMEEILSQYFTRNSVGEELDEDFIDTEFPEIYMETTRDFHEKGLIMYIYDNFQKIESAKHRRIMFYFMNILHFGL